MTVALPRPRREIATYVRRSSRMTPAQQSWLAMYGPRFVVNVDLGKTLTRVAEQEPLDLVTLFGSTAPVVVEIGSGHGETLVAAAQAHPEWNFLAFEVFEASVATTLGKLAGVGTDNVRMIVGDAVTGLTHLIPDASLSQVWIFFPDPWQKKRHHKRRLISPKFVDLLAAKLVDGGTLRLATDWEEYARHMEEVLDANPAFRFLSPDRFDLRPLTKFESRGVAQGRLIRDFSYQRWPR
ncbi:MAG: tRNA (guanosine(46)-N7)-methyltransferase TrmB [Propionibacteriaceae bacterium]|jgi:tRNA (guanine-N7-)-methyltransferase|nr:tRNA (guanosine(46)-N7)-methyltransferase TrmB [Propionibacteriaceae bacterium]